MSDPRGQRAQVGQEENLSYGAKTSICPVCGDEFHTRALPNHIAQEHGQSEDSRR